MKNTGQNRLPEVKGQIVNLTLNLSIIALVYVLAGAATSILIRALFARFNDEWKTHPLFYQIADVSLELSFLVIIAFWITYVVHFITPILPVDGRLEHFIEVYGGRMVFIYAVFLFVKDLDEKLLVVYDRITGDDHDPQTQGKKKANSGRTHNTGYRTQRKRSLIPPTARTDIYHTTASQQTGTDQTQRTERTSRSKVPRTQPESTNLRTRVSLSQLPRAVVQSQELSVRRSFYVVVNKNECRRKEVNSGHLQWLLINDSRHTCLSADTLHTEMSTNVRCD